jgi:membrane protease YdiL (CAAX protease family)
METTPKIDRTRIAVYLAIAFGLAWTTGLAIYLRGGLENSPLLIPEIGFTEAHLLMATTYMFSPAIAHLLTRLITREGWKDTWLRFEFKKSWPYWLMAWFGTPILIAVGAMVYFVLFPQHFDPSLQAVQEFLSQTGQATEEISFSIGTLVTIQIFQAILLAPILNLIPVFGEEFGWRAYLQPKLLPLGERKTYLWMGLIWGVWHAPVIAMGYNYGYEYPGSPWAGVLLFIWVTFGIGTFFGWATLRAKNLWPAVIGHAVLNGTASAVLLFATGEPNPLLGPLMSGFFGSFGFTLMTVWILLRGVKDPETSLAETSS